MQNIGDGLQWIDSLEIRINEVNKLILFSLYGSSSTQTFFSEVKQESPLIDPASEKEKTKN